MSLDIFSFFYGVKTFFSKYNQNFSIFMTLTGSNFEVVDQIWIKLSQFFSYNCPTYVHPISGTKNWVKYGKKWQICSKIEENAQNGDKNCHFGPKMTKSNKMYIYSKK